MEENQDAIRDIGEDYLRLMYGYHGSHNIKAAGFHFALDRAEEIAEAKKVCGTLHYRTLRRALEEKLPNIFVSLIAEKEEHCVTDVDIVRVVPDRVTLEETSYIRVSI